MRKGVKVKEQIKTVRLSLGRCQGPELTEKETVLSAKQARQTRQEVREIMVAASAEQGFFNVPMPEFFSPETF